MAFTQQELSLPLVEAHKAKTVRDSQNEEAAGRRATACGHMMTLLLPMLILLQFGAAFAVEDETTAGLQWNVVCASIALFTLSIFLFRKTMDDMKVTTSIAHLIPELITFAIVTFIFLHQLTVAFLSILAGMLFMAIVVAASSAYLLMTEEEKEKVEAKPIIEGFEIMVV